MDGNLRTGLRPDAVFASAREAGRAAWCRDHCSRWQASYRVLRAAAARRCINGRCGLIRLSSSAINTMCLALLALAAHPRHAVVIAANRDEYHARPAAVAQWWNEGWLGGRDLTAGGTWL